MSIFKRLHLDEVITSIPELGPTIPDGGNSWLVLFGIMIVQMTVPSVLSMYGIVLAHLVENNRKLDFYVWNEKIIVTPILMAACCCLADPWTRTIVSLASVPRLMALIGIALLSIGILASGYLATGGVGAYLASLSAGAIMGIGASFVMIQSEKMLEKHFRIKLPLASTLINISFTTGLVIAPLVALALFTRLGIQAGLMAMVLFFFPTLIAIGFLKAPGKKVSSPYTLLFDDEEEAGPSFRMVEDLRGKNTENTEIPRGIYAEGGTAYSYDDSDDINLFISSSSNNNNNNNIRSKWKESLKIFKLVKFWLSIIACVGMKSGMMLFWILLPPLAVMKIPSTNLLSAVILSIIGACGTLVASIVSFWNPSSARNLIFGFSNWICSFVLIGLTLSEYYSLFVFLALFGGISIGGLVSSHEFAFQNTLGSHIASKARALLNTCVGTIILLLCLIQDMYLCLRVVGIIQLTSGSYWVLFPLFGAIKARCR